MSTRCSDLEIVDQWIQSQPSPLTQDCYRRDVERLRAYTKKPLSSVTLGDLQRFSQSLVDAGLAPISRVRTIAAIRSLFSFASRMYQYRTNPAAELPLPRHANHLAERILPEESVRQLLAQEGTPRDKTLLNLIYLAGVRVSEVTQLRWRNLQVRGDGGQATIHGKGGGTRAVLIPASLWSALTALRCGATADSPVFPSRTGRPLDRGRVCCILREAARQAGVPEADRVSPHWLRHAHASHALDHGAPIHLVQATLGHSSVATTSAYLHARPGDSSARFLPQTFLSKFGRSALPFPAAGVMDVITAASTAKGDYAMTSNEQVQEASPAEAAAPAAEPKSRKATKRAAVARVKPDVAPAKGKSRKKAPPA
jgi:integrase/recombinase XerD